MNSLPGSGERRCSIDRVPVAGQLSNFDIKKSGRGGPACAPPRWCFVCCCGRNTGRRRSPSTPIRSAQDSFIQHGVATIVTAESIGAIAGSISRSPSGRTPPAGRRWAIAVRVGAGAVVLGPITLHDGATVGANATVIHDVGPDGSEPLSFIVASRAACRAETTATLGDGRSRTGICMRRIRPGVGSFARCHRMFPAMKSSSDTSMGASVRSKVWQ